MEDLHALERGGLQRDQCKIVQDSLEKLVIRASAIPDKFFWRQSIMSAMDSFTEAYIEWNSHDGNDNQTRQHRRKSLKKMRTRRQRLAAAVRRNQYILARELDLKLIEDMYDILGAIPKAMPELFANVAKSIASFKSGKKE